MKQKLLTVQQAAKLKSVSRNSIYQAIATKRLRSRLVLGRIALREDDVLAWTPVGSKAGRRKGSPMSEEAKQKLSETQKKRWAERRKRDSTNES